MYELLSTVVEALAGRAGASGIAQTMLQRAAAMESSPNPATRKTGQDLRARANALLATTAAQQPTPPPAPATPAARPAARVQSAPDRPTPPARPTAPLAVTPAPPVNPLLADLRGRSSLLRAIVTMEALGAPLALRDELGGPLTHR
ncbi:MAG TPA: hypothetical protein VME66_08320 [Candidatus Acidoferrales bacterium]|nr:hypothetical protein [Candidatus Acidoferrales bacterium]